MAFELSTERINTSKLRQESALVIKAGVLFWILTKVSSGSCL